MLQDMLLYPTQIAVGDHVVFEGQWHKVLNVTKAKRGPYDLWHWTIKYAEGEIECEIILASDEQLRVRPCSPSGHLEER